MLIAAALIELAIPDADSIKARRRVANSVKDRLRRRYNLSVAELSDPDDRHTVCIGCVMVGVHAGHLRVQLDKAIRYVESLGIAELVGDDVVVARLDEIEEVDEADAEGAPEAWGGE